MGKTVLAFANLGKRRVRRDAWEGSRPIRVGAPVRNFGKPRGVLAQAAIAAKGCPEAKMRRLDLAYSCCFALFFHVSSDCAADSADCKNRFLELYQPQVQKLSQYYSNIRVKATREDNLENGTAQFMESNGKYNLTNFKLEAASKFIDVRTREATTPVFNPQVEAWGRHYSFMLSRNPDDEYVLKKLDPVESKTVRQLCHFLVPVADSVRDRTFLQIAEDDETEFLDLADASWQGQPAKALKTRYKQFSQDTNKWFEHTATYFFSPEDLVCFGFTRIRSGSTKSSQAFYTYGPRGKNGLGDLQRIEEWAVQGDSETRKYPVVEEILEFEHCPPFDDSEFTLSAFGLPEPPGLETTPAPKPTRWYLWIALAGGVSLLGALFFSWRIRKARAAAAGTAKP